MKWPHALYAAVLAGLLAMTAAVAGDGPDADGLLRGLQDWLDSTVTLSGRFEQSLVSSAFGEGIPESGLIWIHRPGRMRWDYTDPEAKTAILDGSSTLFYEQEERQMTVGTLADGGGLLAALLAGQDRLAESVHRRADSATGPHGGEGLVPAADPPSGRGELRGGYPVPGPPLPAPCGGGSGRGGQPGPVPLFRYEAERGYFRHDLRVQTSRGNRDPGRSGRWLNVIAAGERQMIISITSTD